MTSKTPDDFDAVRTIVEALAPFDSKDQERILRWSREKIGLATGNTTAEAAKHVSPTPELAVAASRESPSLDIKSFVESKKPQSDNQFVAIVAYYYRFEAPVSERKATISAEDLQEAARRCGRNRFSRPSQSLVNAHGQGYLDKAERGSYALNTVGENLVAMTLPQSVGTSGGRATKGRKKISKRRPSRQSKAISSTRSKKRKQ